MGWYEAFRENQAVTQYDEIHTPATVDVFSAGLIFAFVAVGFSFLILLPGYMLKERYSVALRISLSLFIGAGILFSNFGMDWETSEVETETQYKAFMSQEIKAKIGVKIGLRGVNVTLKGIPEKQKFDHNKTTEVVNYNEEFRWNAPWAQGRQGFGPHATQLNNEYHDALHKGIPYPILLIAEYFTIDGERIRWGRCFRQGGFYTHMALWLAFTLWIITNILFLMVIRYGAYFLSLTGVVILLGNMMYEVLHWGPHLVIPFPGGNLNFKYGWCFWFSLVTGFLCLVLGVVIVIMDYFSPTLVSTFFNIDIVTEYEDVVEEHEIFPDVSNCNLEADISTSEDDVSTEPGESSKKRIHFVAKSRYGISSWNPGKSPLVHSKSSPIASSNIENGKDSPQSIPRATSVTISMEQTWDNPAFDTEGEERNSDIATTSTE